MDTALNKILIWNTEDGKQVLSMIGVGGGCTDKECEVWNENVDGPFPMKLTMIGGLVRKGKELVYDEALMAKQKELEAAAEKAAAEKAQAKIDRQELFRNVEKASSLEELKAVLKAVIDEANLAG